MSAHRTWSEILVDLDGHIHSPAKNCAHRAGDACRVCCAHADEPRIAEPEPSDYYDDDMASARALAWCLIAVAVAVVVAAVSALTVAGVIPS